MDPNHLPVAFDSFLHKHAQACGLTDVLPKLRIVARPSFSINLIAPAILNRFLGRKQNRVGASRFGGLPDLPPNIAWPERDGKRLIFIAQINFEEMPPGVDCLPKRGRLYFFLGNDDFGWNVSHSVFYVDCPAEKLISLDQPPRGSFIDTVYQHPFRPAAVRFTPAVTIPPLHHDSFFDEHCDALDELRSRLSGDPDGKIGRLLGHGTDFGGDAAAEAYVVSQGRAQLIHHLHANAAEQLDRKIEEWQNTNQPNVDDLLKLKSMLPWYHANLEHHASEIANWQLLLEVDSHSACNMMWWDMGVLQFMIDTRDLVAGDFSKTYACIESH